MNTRASIDRSRSVLPGGQASRALIRTRLLFLLQIVAAMFITLNLFSGCAVNKATGQRQLILISESKEIEMGREADQQISASMGLYPDSALQQYISNLGADLASRCERPNLPWTFRLVDDPIVNAFALPGGFIYVTRGILAYLNSEAELAGVVGHEIGHVTGKHSVSRISKAQVAQIGLGVGQILEPGLEKYSQLASAGLGLLFLKFSRDDETQADELGLRYMTRAGNDPREMAGVMTMLDRVTTASGGRGVPEWLATHPDPGNRRENIESHLAGMSGDFSSAHTNRDSYLRRLDGLIFGENPRHGYFKGATFYHPDLEFLMQFPEGWQSQNQMQAVLAVSPEQNVLIQLTLSQAASAREGVRQFLAQEGIVAGQPHSVTVNGLPAVSADFSAQTDEGVLKGMVTVIDYEKQLYQLLAYGTSEGWDTHQAAARNSIGSFQRLTDRKALAVQPMRLDIVKLDRGMTIEEFADRYPGPVGVETLTLINRVDSGAQIPAGTLIKRIVGEKIE